MYRTRFSDLWDWLNSPDRKPLVIRGARQVGKTWLVRQLAQAAGLELIEFNFEDRKQDISLFRTNDPVTTIQEIGSARNINIVPEKSLLFLDEMQVAPELFAKLRWFAEKMPNLAVIGTGSLLDFALEKHTFSMPVGRIGYLYLEPLSFEEFLHAKKNKGLIDYLGQFTLESPIPEAIHEQLISTFKEYMIIGGLPAAVYSWINNNSLINVNKIHHDLASNYREDFGKYHGRLSIEYLEDAMSSVPKQLSQKFTYSHANENAHTNQIKQALNLLNKARVIHAVVCTHGNGLPLSAETNKKYFKEISVDVGLCSGQLGLTLDEVQSISEISLINKGGIAEQVVGQILRTIFPFYVDPSLYCWMRTTPNSNAEVDYIIQHKNQVIPIEVKAGKTGKLKSLHYFMSLKEFDLAIRVNSGYPNITKINLKNTKGDPIQFKLLSIPFYLIGQLHRLIDTL